MANILKQTSRGITPVTISDEMMSNHRTLFFIGECSDATCSQLLQELMYLENESSDEIILYINSPGGDVTSGLAVIDYIDTMESPLTTIVSGNAASMGGLLFLAGDRRLMYRNSRVMLHSPYFANRSISGKNPDEIQVILDDLKGIRKLTDASISEHTGLSMEEVYEITRKDSWFSAEEALARGLATEIIPRRKINRKGV